MTKIVNFNFGKNTKATIFCRSRDTKNGFAHDCAIPALKIRVTTHYLNRTWECYSFQSVIHNAFDKYLKGIYPGKRNEKIREREYEKLTDRLDRWYCKGKFRNVSEFENAFALAV